MSYKCVLICYLPFSSTSTRIGEDRIQFLHNQSTANFEALSEGGKTAVTLVVSPSTSGSISEMLKKYVMVDLNLGDLIGQPLALQSHMQVGGNSVTVAVGSVISEQGFSLLMSPAAAGVIWKTLLSHGTTPMGSNALETYRILQGCYKGQETIARLITYDGIKQKLWGIQLSSPVEPGSPITVEGKKAGKLTSYTAGKKENEHFGLGYIKKKAASKGDTVMIGDDISGIVVDVPYLARQRPLVLNSNP
ncbi:hypothetical protein L1987_01910 [Smallanthus sonchifolius]|uniref:Uncharacterized protein n=1 Tax=Smallanthus sonchifolius TaxID=185202 RepID=A0ACB9K6J0_9ASTR|nr:hypothetical protein L1987_01910 [Smallanthus sonchifolius]